MKYNITTSANNGTAIYENGKVSFLCQNESTDISFSLRIDIPWWDTDTYVFMPACVYNGNRFKKSTASYPPMYSKEECGIIPEPIISDVPALNPDGSGSIEVTSGDLSVPCMGVFSQKDSCAFFVFTEQECKEKNIGFFVQTGRVEIQFPAMRKKQYRMCNANAPSHDRGISMKAGEQTESQVIIKTFPCESISHFYQIFFENRRILLSDRHAKTEYTKKLWNILEEHLNRDNYSGAYYAEISKKWQAGWVGGGMSSLPLLKFGNPISKSCAISTIDFLTSHISAAGFFYGMIVDGKISDDGFGHEQMKNALLIRKNGDALYFLFKHFDVITPKEAWIVAAKRCTDAFVRLFERYGDFGQFIHIETGEMLFGGTASGASAIGALVRAGQYFKDEKYLQTANDPKYKEALITDSKEVEYLTRGNAKLDDYLQAKINEKLLPHYGEVFAIIRDQKSTWFVRRDLVFTTTGLYILGHRDQKDYAKYAQVLGSDDNTALLKRLPRQKREKFYGEPGIDYKLLNDMISALRLVELSESRGEERNQLVSGINVMQLISEEIGKW